jgi:phage gp36-like protein
MNLELDPARLERAVMAQCEAYSGCLCQRNGGIDNLICARGLEGASAAIRAYLGPEYERERAVVEAAKEWVKADADANELDADSPSWTGSVRHAGRSRNRFFAAVAALTKETGA